MWIGSNPIGSIVTIVVTQLLLFHLDLIMKPLEELRSLTFTLASKSTSVGKVRNFIQNYQYNLDDEVFIPSIKMNLQRPLVWTLGQKQELIMSILCGRFIPPLAMCTKKGDDDTYYIIDGKQRLNAIISFAKDEFSVELEGKLYTLSQLREVAPDYAQAIELYHVESAMAYDLTESQMVEWFLSINFAGTPQDEGHKKELLIGHSFLKWQEG